MSNTLNWGKVKIVAGLLAATFLYLYFSSPGKVVVDNNGNVKGLINNVRASIQGKEFWKNQLKEVNSELEWERNEPQRQAKLDREMNQMFRELDQSMEEMYQEYPDMRPSAAERQAEALRDRADQIEQQEFDRYLEKLRLERIAELKIILPLVKARAE
jgi:sRNA-binding protein